MAEATKTPRKMTKVSDTVLEIFETKVSMKDLEAVIKKRSKSKRIKRRDQNLPERRAESRLLHRRRTGI